MSIVIIATTEGVRVVTCNDARIVMSKAQFPFKDLCAELNDEAARLGIKTRYEVTDDVAARIKQLRALQ